MSFTTWFQRTFPTTVSARTLPVVQCSCGSVAFWKHPVIMVQKAYDHGIPDTKWLHEVSYIFDAQREKYMAGVKEYECVVCGVRYDREGMLTLTGSKPLQEVLEAR